MFLITKKCITSEYVVKQVQHFIPLLRLSQWILSSQQQRTHTYTHQYEIDEQGAGAYFVTVYTEGERVGEHIEGYGFRHRVGNVFDQIDFVFRFVFRFFGFAIFCVKTRLLWWIRVSVR